VTQDSVLIRSFVPERIAILDDFQDVALQFGDWSRLTTRAQTTVFHDHVADEDSLVERLRPFSVIALMRERTPFPRSLIERLPNLRLILTSGMFNRSLSTPSALRDCSIRRASMPQKCSSPKRRQPQCSRHCSPSA
jgi:hypothetical protein